MADEGEAACWRANAISRWPRVRRYGIEIAANAKISGASAQMLQRLWDVIESNIAEKAWPLPRLPCFSVETCTTLSPKSGEKDGAPIVSR